MDQEREEHLREELKHFIDEKLLDLFKKSRDPVGEIREMSESGDDRMVGFLPTRYELLELARYWYRRRLQINFQYWWAPQIDRYILYVEPFAGSRLGFIAEFLGDATISKMIEDVKAEFSKGISPTLWRMFLEGEEPERDEKGFPIDPGPV